MLKSKPNELKTKTLNFLVTECKEVEVNGVSCFEFKGHASTFGDIDLGDDVCTSGCFEESLIKRTPKLLWQHKMSEPLGVFKACREDDKGLYVEGVMPKEDTFVSGRVVPQMKVGSINSMSIGYNTVDSEIIKSEDGRMVRLLKKVDLWEISLVTFPMNENAEVTDIKGNDDSLPYKNILEVSKLLKTKFTKSESDDIIFSIKKLCSCNESKVNPCNEEILTSELEAYFAELKKLKKEI